MVGEVGSGIRCTAAVTWEGILAKFVVDTNSIYLLIMPPCDGNLRRAEIASDVWHSVHDPDRDAPWR